jgi:hypothetical protein
VVLDLSNTLRSHGINVELDRYHVPPEKGWPHWCEEQLRPENSKFVIVVCTDTYRRRVEGKIPVGKPPLGQIVTLPSYSAGSPQSLAPLPRRSAVTEFTLTETDLVPEAEQPEGEITMPATTRDQILISYSHKDKKLFQEVKTMLAPAIQKGIVNIWDDTMIRPGAQWKAEIEKALASVRVGVLLVSENFLESEFITKNELPPLLKAAQDDDATIFWVYLSHCLYQHTEIEQFQAAHDISRPLNELPKPRRNAAWREICNKLMQIAQNP